MLAGPGRGGDDLTADMGRDADVDDADIVPGDQVAVVSVRVARSEARRRSSELQPFGRRIGDRHGDEPGGMRSPTHEMPHRDVAAADETDSSGGRGDRHATFAAARSGPMNAAA